MRDGSTFLNLAKVCHGTQRFKRIGSAPDSLVSCFGLCPEEVLQVVIISQMSIWMDLIKG